MGVVVPYNFIQGQEKGKRVYINNESTYSSNFSLESWVDVVSIRIYSDGLFSFGTVFITPKSGATYSFPANSEVNVCTITNLPQEVEDIFPTMYGNFGVGVGGSLSSAYMYFGSWSSSGGVMTHQLSIRGSSIVIQNSGNTFINGWCMNALSQNFETIEV